MNFRLIDDHTLGISLDEATSESDVVEIWQVFKGDKAIGFTVADVAADLRLAPGFRPGVENERRQTSRFNGFLVRARNR